MLTKRDSLWSAFATLAVLGLADRCGAQETVQGVVVEGVATGLAAERAGLLAGDVLLSWRRQEAAQGEFRTPFDVDQAEIEEAPRGEIALSVLRGVERLDRVMPPGHWGLKTRPPLTGLQLEQYERGRKQIASGALDAGLAPLREAAEHSKPENALLACWWLSHIAAVQTEQRLWKAAQASLLAAVERADALGASSVRSRLRELLAAAFEKDNEWVRAAELHREALEIREANSRDSLAVAASLQNLGLVALSRGDLSSADQELKRALAIRQKLSPGSRGEAATLVAIGRVAVRRGDVVVAEDSFLKALRIFEDLESGSLDIAIVLNNLGVVAGSRGDIAAAEGYFERARSIRETFAPNSAEMASTLINLAKVTHSRGKLDLAEEHLERAFSIQEKLEPESLRSSATLFNLGAVIWTRGDLPRAEQYFRRVMAIRERHAPGSLDVAEALVNLGGVLRDRGNLVAAEQFIRRALDVMEALSPESLDLAEALGHFADVVLRRGDAALAEQHFKRALDIREKLSPGAPGSAETLEGLGLVAQAREDFTEAEEYLKRALSIREAEAPDSLLVASSLHALGANALQREDLGNAERFFQRAATLRERLAPQSLPLAESLDGLGRVAWARERRDQAEEHYRRSLAIREELAPGSEGEAETLYLLATLYRKSEPLRALDFLRRAVEALESQRVRLGGSESTRVGWGAGRASYYRSYLSLLVELGRNAEAFAALERSRARAFLELLAERDLVFSSDLTPDLERKRRLANAEYEGVLKKMTQPSDSSETRSSLREALRHARLRQEEVEASIRSSAPRLASLQYPEPLDLDAAQRFLSPGDLLLSYSVSEDRTHLFAVGPEQQGLAVFTLDVGRPALGADVERFRAFLRDGSDGDTVKMLASRLTEKLLAPVADRVSRAERLVVLPDGPLHYLPFAALRDPSRAEWRYLIEAKPLSLAASVTVLAELRKRSRANRPGRGAAVVAFGDPVYPAGAHVNGPPQSLEALRGSLRLTPLPGTRSEVEALAALYPGTSRLYLGPDAREEKAKALPPELSVVHFACHALVNEQFPLESALALSIPESSQAGVENGLLQAWEILEQTHFDADLVTLSACESGLGREMAGEGIAGLTRAFHYAGARSVLASLWEVNDRSTAMLMSGFYGYFKEGKDKDEALRRAQLDLIRGAPGLAPELKDAIDASHPYHWAGFVLVGDSR